MVSIVLICWVEVKSHGPCIELSALEILVNAGCSMVFTQLSGKVHALCAKH